MLVGWACTTTYCRPDPCRRLIGNFRGRTGDWTPRPEVARCAGSGSFRSHYRTASVRRAAPLGGRRPLELYRRHPGIVTTLIMIDAYAGWKGSLPAEEVRARVDGARQMLAAPPEHFDPTLPGLFASHPPAEFVPLLAAISADVRPATLGRQPTLMAEADQRDLLPRIRRPALLIWGTLDARSPLSVARQFDEAIPDTELVVIEAPVTSATSSNPSA